MAYLSGCATGHFVEKKKKRKMQEKLIVVYDARTGKWYFGTIWRSEANKKKKLHGHVLRMEQKVFR